MKTDRFTVAAALISIAAAAHLVNCTEIATISGTVGGAGRSADDYELVCPADYVHITTYDGDTIDNYIHVTRSQIQHRRRRRRNNRAQIGQQEQETQQPIAAHEPITITRQGQSFIEFIVQNTTWFASAATSAGIDVKNRQTLQVFTKVPTDEYGSERCYLTEDISSVSFDSTSKIMQARCGAEALFVVIRIYARFDNADNDNNKPSIFEVPTCCPYPHGSNFSSSKVIEYTFQLNCLPKCENPIEYIDSATTDGLAVSSIVNLSKNSKMSSTTSASTLITSAARIAEPLQKQNRAKGVGMGTKPKRTSSWDKMYQRLIAYKDKHNGNTKVPDRYNQDPQLGHWVQTQRQTYKNEKMPAERANLLDSIGFDWSPARGAPGRESWNEMYLRLIAYQSVHGNTKVPRKYEQDRQLAIWVKNQRRAYKMKTMATERVTLLNSIDFEWDVISTQRDWNEMYQRLVAYKNEHDGNTKVPFRYDKDPHLGEWANIQRQAYKNKKMPTDRAGLLNSIGFDWEVRSSSWDEMYRRLILYKSEHNGDTKVPAKYDRDVQLGKWVSNQRRAYKMKRISKERADLLSAMDFDWEVTSGTKSNSGVGDGAGTVGSAGDSSGSKGTPPTIPRRNNASSSAGAGPGADAFYVAPAVAARFRVATARLRGHTRSANLARSYYHTKKGCNTIRGTSKVSRMLCVAKNHGPEANLKFLKSEMSETHSKSVSKLDSFERMPSVHVFKTLSHKKVSKSMMSAAATPSF